MKYYIPPVIAYAGKIVSDVVFLKSVHNTKYWLILMNKEDGFIIGRLKHILLPNITMMKIEKKNKFPKRCNKN